MDEPRLEWGEAEVRDGVLTVQIAGDRPKGWNELFERTVALLRGGDWDEVKLKSGKVSVTGLREGDEETLHHFLEGVMQQANASHPDVGVQDGADEDESGGQADEVESADDTEADTRMTERFRGLRPD